LEVGVSKIPEGVDRHELNVVARRVLLDALHALADQRGAITIVGAQAIDLRSVEVNLAVASYTSDADLGIDPDLLGGHPLLEAAMEHAGFSRTDPNQPGTWTRPERVGRTVQNIAVDLLVPESLSGGGRRSVDIPPHDRMAARRVPGLEAVVIDADFMAVSSLEPQIDARTIQARVAGVAALLVAKAYKIHQRANEPDQRRLTNKDAGDVLRLMMNTDPADITDRLDTLLADARTAEVTRRGLGYLRELFSAPRTLGTNMAVDALEAVVNEATVRAIAPAYLAALGRRIS
jgi:hypothetical protein